MRENGLRYELSFGEGYSAGIFLDQRDNRRRLLTGYAGPALSLEKRGTPPAVLNLFAYTCAFSVCAAEAGAVTTSVDLSAKYLNWGKRNFALNGLDPSAHEFFVADAFDMLRRFGKKSREFDLVLLDPPTFSQSKVSGVFRAEADYGKLVKAAAPLVRAEGILFASTNAAKWSPERFVEVVLGACKEAGRRVSLSLFFPQPLDFRISAEEPGYLKTLWVKLD
jgi:23S rRNA (cytosine1962-C5)-methyltransferase